MREAEIRADERERIIALLRGEAEQARREGHRTTQLVIEAMAALIEEEARE